MIDRTFERSVGRKALMVRWIFAAVVFVAVCRAVWAQDLMLTACIADQSLGFCESAREADMRDVLFGVADGVARTASVIVVKVVKFDEAMSKFSEWRNDAAEN